MARTISQLSAGASVFLDETVSGVVRHVEYYYLGLDESGNARLLRSRTVSGRTMNATDMAGYSGCEADVWLEDSSSGFLSRFDTATLAALQNTSIKYVDYASGTAQVLTIARRCFLLSYSEVGYGNDAAGNEGQSYLAALKTAARTSSDSSARIAWGENGQVVRAWLRSSYSDTEFRLIFTNGNATYAAATYASAWLRPALSVLPTTPVSDEGAERTFLLPDGRRTTWDIDASVSLGVTANRPKSCKLMLPHESFVSLSAQVCNNYADANPTWVSCTDGGTASFGTSKTAESWELGVKIYAEAAAPDRMIGEPAMIVEFADE